MNEKFAGYSIEKASTVRDLGDLNNLHDLTGMISRTSSIPGLLSSVINPTEIFFKSDTFEHDQVENLTTDQIEAKPYNDRGDYVGKEVVKTHLMKIPHYPIQGRVRPSDYAGIRQPGTDAVLDTKSRLVGNELAYMDRAYRLLQERSLAHVLVNGTAFNNTSEDFYQNYTGAARPAAVDFTLGTSTVYPREKGEEVRGLILNGVNDGFVSEGFIAFCGKSFFQKRISHIKEEQVYVQRQAMGQDPLVERLGLYANQYRSYRGADDILYVEYPASIGGTDIIATADAYIMPVNASELFLRGFAPAETDQYANTVAQRNYAWRIDSEFTGTRVMRESNFVDALVNPLGVVKCTTSN